MNADQPLRDLIEISLPSFKVASAPLRGLYFFSVVTPGLLRCARGFILSPPSGAIGWKRLFFTGKGVGSPLLLGEFPLRPTIVRLLATLFWSESLGAAASGG